MGIMGADNAWWLDVLENGPASAWGNFFDIDWEPLNPGLRGKVLLPMLGDHYGTVLERGELRLGFDAARGEFSLFYYQHRLPLDPASYPRIIAHRGERLAASLGRDPRALRRTANPARQPGPPAGAHRCRPWRAWPSASATRRCTSAT